MRIEAVILTTDFRTMASSSWAQAGRAVTVRRRLAVMMSLLKFHTDGLRGESLGLDFGSDLGRL